MINPFDAAYNALGEHILQNGVKKEDRTGTGTLSVFGYQMRFDLSQGFPLLMGKRLPLRIIFEELDWFLEGNTDAADLAKRNVKIWTPDAYRWHKEQGGTMTYEEFEQQLLQTNFRFNLGPIYGKQWRSWDTGRIQHVGDDDYPSHITIDQITQVIEEIKKNPNSRRLIVSAWNPGDLEEMALPPCHILFQFHVANGKLNCQLYQRSADFFLGVPFNIASYALLTMMIAQQTELEPGEFIHTFGDAHIYLNHVDQVMEQISRPLLAPPTLTLTKRDSIFDYTYEDLKLEGYEPHAVIKGKVSVG